MSDQEWTRPILYLPRQVAKEMIDNVGGVPEGERVKVAKFFLKIIRLRNR